VPTDYINGTAMEAGGNRPAYIVKHKETNGASIAGNLDTVRRSSGA
jgi:hypothetical protein